jgi:alkylation response protein AidB-like acyl-CoA dehydrogenase
MSTVTETPTRWADIPQTHDEWLHRTDEVVAQLAIGVVERDQAARPPHEQIELLKDAGLVTLVGPIEHGGAGLRDDWALQLKIIRAIARIDGSIANILAWHYAQHWLLRAVGTDEQRERLEADFARNRWLSAGIVNIRDTPLSGPDEGDDLRLSGRKAFNTGVPVADLILLHGVTPAGEHFFGYAPHGTGGIHLEDTWDTLGQRSTVSGPAVVTDVRLPWSNVLGFDDEHRFVPKAGAGTIGLVSQLLMANIYLGLAQGALAQAIEFTRHQSRPWQNSLYERAVDEPHIVDAYGALRARLVAVEALEDQLGERVTEFLADLDAYDPDVRADIAADISAAKLLSTEVGLDVTSQVFELTSARATDRSLGLDRYWRDLRTHSLHDPAGYKRRQIGAWLLRGEAQPATDWYA